MSAKILRAFAILFITTNISFYSQKSFAITQYRCSGVIQYRPCNDDRAIPALMGQRKNTENISISSARARMNEETVSPNIFLAEYKYSKELKAGVWNGFVYGNGPVVLSLVLNVLGSEPEFRYMGRVVLARKASPFEFHSTPPKGSHWSWQITAKNEAN